MWALVDTEHIPTSLSAVVVDAKGVPLIRTFQVQYFEIFPVMLPRVDKTMK